MRLFKKREKQLTSGSAWIDFLNIGDVDKSGLSEATYFACLKVLSESVGKLPLKLMKEVKGGGVAPAYDNSKYQVCNSQPNKYMTATHFWGTVEFNRNHFGNAYVWIRVENKKLALYILPSNQIEIMIDDKGIWGKTHSLYYIYRPQKGGEYVIPYDSILHFKTSCSEDGVTGKSVRSILKDTFEGNLKAQKMLNKSYSNGFTGKVVLQYTGDLDAVKEKEYTRRINEYAKGDEGSVIPMMLGTSIQPINTNLADNQFIELKKYSALQIAAAFGIKPNQINDYEKSSYASAEAQQLAFYVDTLLYILKQYEEELGNKLLSEQELADGYFFKFNVNVILRADLKTQIESLNTAVQGGIKTPNEARSMLDMPSVPGGDVLICNGNMMPVAMAGKQFNKGGEKIE